MAGTVRDIARDIGFIVCDTFQRGIYSIGNDYVRMYIVEHHHTRGDLRLVRRV